ncbi:MarR family winged helix-turn-helix transcriptional regulator [Amycolatopsis sp. NPDC049252]|uniref:MarR family winged helix-turn-helix transcriptional regulator n=1 Tax=Amycolatopsis sp. NPDC049252 TaxID=3363933 RepID=UPI00370FF54D
MSEVAALGLRYLEVAHQVRRKIDEQLAADGISLARLKLLQAVDRHAPVNQAALAENLTMAPRSITQAVEALERDGLVRRTAAPGDRRSKLVVLTAAGSATLATGVAAGEKAVEQAFGALDAGQLASLRALLDTVEAGTTDADVTR